MTQVLEAGLAQVLREHEDKIAAAQAWCVQQNIRSLDELKLQGETAIDEFVKAVGAVKVLGGKTLNLNYYMLKGWCGDCLERDRDISDLPLHNLRRTTIDILRWIPGWDRAEFEPYLESDDEDDEEDPELICRPRTIGGIPQTCE